MEPLGKRERFVWQAAMAALALHVIVLAALAEWGELPAATTTRYAAVDFVDFEVPERTMTMEEAVREQMEARLEAVRNVAADARASLSDDVHSTAASEEMARDVEAELRAFEQSAFDALAEGRTGSDGVSAPDRSERQEVQNEFENWDARYDGQVTAEYDLDGRKALVLDVPGYRCRGGGTVTLAIEVAPGGEVMDAQVLSVRGTRGQAVGQCLGEESLRSALKCRFQSRTDAPKRQSGRLTYRFIAQ
jgi:hypothetical protein